MGKIIHGESLSKTKEYRTWNEIKKRCKPYGKKRSMYYGDIGIRVCDRWIESYQNFLDDMGRAPGPSFSIERNDITKNYEPGNCRWATLKEQANNKRNNHYIEINGVVKTLTQWCEYHGVPAERAFKRIRRHGWSDVDAVSIPIRNYKMK